LGALKHTLLRLSAASKLPRLISPSPKDALTTILYHRFFAPNETLGQGRSRLKYQLEWLQNNYTPIPTQKAVESITKGTLPASPLTVTADDAFVDLLNVHDIFKEFEIPLTVFVCTGWIDNIADKEKYTLSSVIDFFRWYRGGSKIIDLGKYGKIDLSLEHVDSIIDWIIIQSKHDDGEFIPTLREAIIPLVPKATTRVLCNWDELIELSRLGLAMGSHTVTHCELAKVSATRLNFELSESKLTLESYFNECNMFAYPFGTRHVINQATTDALKKTDIIVGF
jgi:peptidoglycan/xylan/chitin deacetylase (PgdA/CDA1 family)